MLDLQQLDSFRTVARLQSFTHAGVVLGFAQPTVTFHIKRLEKELKVALFRRGRFSREVRLTKAGERLLAYSDKLLELAREATAAARPKSKCA
jgi:DNA-binding transcriptional LysR family regulator